MNELFQEKFTNFLQFLETKLTEANLESDKLQKLKLLNQTNLFKPLFKIHIPFIQELLQTHNLNLLVKFDFTENEIKLLNSNLNSQDKIKLIKYLEFFVEIIPKL